MSDINLPAKNWIYNLSDYQQIFALTDQDLQKKTLDFASGISSVNAELYAQGQTIVSVDPNYRLSPKDMQVQARQILQDNITYLRQHLDSLPAPHAAFADTLIVQWRHSTEQFIADYELGKKQGRYLTIDYSPFTKLDQTFELLLCTDFLFNSTQSLKSSSQDIMNELCKLAVEVRIFPLPEVKTTVAAELGPIMLALQNRNFGVEIRAVNYPMRKDANAILRVWAKECEVI